MGSQKLIQFLKNSNLVSPKGCGGDRQYIFSERNKEE
jgi:hypothetical protein